MPLFEDLINWTKITFLPFGELGLFIVAFAESSFFPIPPDLLLIPLVLLNPYLGLWYAFICTLGSVLGAVFGYYIGYKGGRPLLKKFVSDKKIKRVEDYYKKYGIWAVGIAAFTPIPYKIFTIASGVLKFDLKKMVFVSILGRGGRFFSEAIILMIFGQQIMDFMMKYFEITTIIIVAIVLILIYFWKFRK